MKLFAFLVIFDHKRSKKDIANKYDVIQLNKINIIYYNAVD